LDELDWIDFVYTISGNRVEGKIISGRREERIGGRDDHRGQTTP
jgi:hypothetical protein